MHFYDKTINKAMTRPSHAHMYSDQEYSTVVHAYLMLLAASSIAVCLHIASFFAIDFCKCFLFYYAHWSFVWNVGFWLQR